MSIPWKQLLAKAGAFLLNVAKEEGKKAIIKEAEKHGIKVTSDNSAGTNGL